MKRILTIAQVLLTIAIFSQAKESTTFRKKYTEYTTTIDGINSPTAEADVLVKFSNGHVFITHSQGLELRQKKQQIIVGISDGIEYKQAEYEPNTVLQMYADGRIIMSLTPEIAKELGIPNVPNNPDENYIELRNPKGTIKHN